MKILVISTLLLNLSWIQCQDVPDPDPNIFKSFVTRVEDSGAHVTELKCEFDDQKYVWLSEGFNGYPVVVHPTNQPIDLNWEDDIAFDRPRRFTCNGIIPKVETSALTHRRYVSNDTYTGLLQTIEVRKIMVNVTSTDPETNEEITAPETTIEIQVVNGFVYFPCDAWFIEDPSMQSQKIEDPVVTYYARNPDMIRPVYFDYVGDDDSKPLNQTCETAKENIEYQIRKRGTPIRPYLEYVYTSTCKNKLMGLINSSTKQTGSGVVGIFVAFSLLVVGIISYRKLRSVKYLVL